MNEYRQAMVEAARSGDSKAFYRAKAVAEFMEAEATLDFPSYFFDREFGDIRSAPGMGLRHPFEPGKHPRGRHGRWIDVLKTLKSSPRAGLAGVTLPSGHRVTHRFGQLRVHDREGKIVARGANPEDLRRQLDKRRTTPEVQTPRLRVFDATRVAAKADPGTLLPSGASRAAQDRASTLTLSELPLGSHVDPTMKLVVHGRHAGVDYMVPFRTRDEAQRFLASKLTMSHLRRVMGGDTGMANIQAGT